MVRQNGNEKLLKTFSQNSEALASEILGNLRKKYSRVVSTNNCKKNFI